MRLEITFGDTIRQLRENKKLTLREVAEALKIDTSMLGKIEKNSRKPTKQLINKFADFFNVSDKELRLVFLSDAVAYRIMDDEDLASEIFKVAEEKVEYLKTLKKVEQ